MKKKVNMAAPFAHLLGMFSASKAEGNDGDEDEKAQGADESDEDYAKRMEDDERKQGADESDEDYAKRLKAMDQEDEGGDGDDGDDDGDSDTDDKKSKAARAKERARCAKIFSSPLAATRPDVAAYLAFNTGVSSATAIGMLGAAGAQKATPRTALQQRMANQKHAKPGVDGAASAPKNSAQAMAEQIIAAGKMRRGEK